ncbi:bifunctional proline dehydrogenase/L-glutamate gamma-semialdehyde dehydrogenase PutA [Salinivibrio kushneri]|uniref:bifunctional proline dehydrogenase/L-glutamate gamma-semialdehyde dehydrogenase PutA n=1 Tax=Salinivibrio kushneri TaxID=1908198 RepID=UPI000986419A|nr:bifunctional proline dehydrogenase/L-glutamate gamma-semialdehyde dehydrogenase PutA [Salinivibrio kushneri]OOE47343.1 bifunctional proline dehydrogenase/L-glutamate gamma-semialdehyde dehydrogenase [Salinivibrio kushneri]OOE49441.1 bifunctional proline dehydrogenase/L-glutamate gamma-semialdehyde dehydrogenase [Salinivibrio kushneri]OOE62817.1 bifunctional proline dehydrogenase/L-glutamate gamma-semialdehyde dehydrogenase [Salinivibrio kushneri]
MFKAIDAMQPSFIERPLAQLWSEISPLYCVDESLWLQQLIPLAEATDSEREQTRRQATQLIEQVRADKKAVQMIDALLLEYSLDTREGILLMCLAEALMRIPDSHTADALIRDKLSVADWKAHLRHSDSLFVNASTWGLMLTGKVVTLDESTEGKPTSVINRLVNKMSEPVIRQAMHQAMKIMGHQFVLGRDIDEAQKNGEGPRNNGFTYSFDMLGEAALTQEDAKAYLADYLQAIESVGDAKASYQGPSPSVSIKLSALHPRYEAANYDRMMDEMFETVLVLLKRAREKDVAITIDAEEADRLELSLALFEKLYRDPVVKGWGKFGLVVQAYSKRALPVITWLAALAKEQGDVIPMRLVKGAYWDSEIKLCQQTGHHGYPVFTRKEGTDVSYLACARFLLSEHIRGLIYPQFASHNAHTIAAIASMATHQDFEFQRLHGMGDALYNHAKALFNTEVRIYAPVGSHKDLLPYLVRRLLENGANSSFVHRLVDARCPIDDLIADPVDTLRANPTLHNDRIPLPLDIFGASRKNSQGVATDIDSEWQPFTASVAPFMGAHQWQAGPIVNGQRLAGDTHPIAAPYDREEPVGHVDWATSDQVNNALDIAANAYPEWSKTAVSERGKYLLDLADKLEANLGELVAICHREAGKTIHDSIDEVREAVDFLRYYPEQAKALQGEPLSYTGFDGQMQSVSYQGRGVFTCISPWNFPLAIFLGQVSAALVAGNTVVAKPAEQTSIIAYRAIELLLETGIPTSVIQLLPGSGPVVGAPLTEDSRIAGVAFTGSTPTAQRITRTLADRDADPVPVVAETGGQNAMLVDSTALPEQVVRDVLRSAFASAGQRCSALRVLYIQEDIADRVISLIKGAMAELSVGRPERLSTDVGPVIDQTAKDKLLAHIEQMKRNGKLVTQVPLSAECDKGTFVPPTAFEIRSIDQLSEEHFGPILHIVRYRANELDKVIDDINRTGFGLTMGVHSRNETTCAHIEHRARVGNCYVNRDQVGAVVGVQPFGGRGLSGTGPKAGGPHYLYRFTQASVNVQ